MMLCIAVSTQSDEYVVDRSYGDDQPSMLARNASGNARANGAKPVSASQPVTTTYTAKRIAKRFCASHRRRCASFA